MSTEQRPDGRLEHHDVHYDLLGQPFTPPDYTMKQLRDAIVRPLGAVLVLLLM